MSKRSAIAHTLLFVLTISLPVAANLAGMDGADPAAENRELASFPRLELSADFSYGLSAWFNDHFGFRSSLVRWNAWLRYAGFGVSPSSAVVRGRDGWLFYAEDGAIDDYVGADLLSSESVANWREAVVRARDWLRARQVAYVFTIVPDKHVVYPEQVPDSIRRIGSELRMDQVLDGLEGTGVAIDLRSALFAAKQQERIYHVTDSHWNARGALAAYQAIVAAVRTRVSGVPPAWQRSDFEAVSRKTRGGDLAGMIGLTRILREEDLALVPKRPRLARVVDPSGAAPTAELGRLVTEIPGSTLPRAVIFRDSFVSPLVPFLSEHFSRAVYLWQNDFDADAVVHERADIVIQEIVGRHLYTFIPSPELIPR